METTTRARLRAGDPGAFRELFGEHHRSVYNHAFRMTGNWSTAEDVVSLAFLEAWRLRARLDADAGAGSLRAWLLGITTNVARNVRRSARRYGDMLARLPKADVEPDTADEVITRMDGHEQLTAALSALDSLRKPEREVLSLYVWSELEYVEIAEALGVPVGTVRSRLSRARKKLAKLAAAGVLRSSEDEREPRHRPGQIRGDRTKAVRFVQETTR